MGVVRPTRHEDAVWVPQLTTKRSQILGGVIVLVGVACVGEGNLNPSGHESGRGMYVLNTTRILHYFGSTEDEKRHQVVDENHGTTHVDRCAARKSRDADECVVCYETDCNT